VYEYSPTTFLAKYELSSYTAAFDEHRAALGPALGGSLPALQETSPTMT
jgi:hypothetical protein